MHKCTAVHLNNVIMELQRCTRCMHAMAATGFTSWYVTNQPTSLRQPVQWQHVLQPTSLREPDCSLAICFTSWYVTNPSQPVSGNQIAVATCFAGFGILTMGSLAATGSEDNGFNYMGNIALTHNVDHKQFILWLLWFNSFYCHALVLLQLRLANQSMTFVWILTGTNIRIYSCQENDTNE